MTSSPAVQSRYAHSPVARKRFGPGQFAETSPRTMIGLQKVNVQLQKEMDKLDRQAQTAVTNIANHQQAMKMSWRRLEQKRNAESPLLSRTGKHAQASSPAPKQRWGMLSSNTRLYVHATPDIYRPREGDEKEGRGKEEGGSEEESRQSDVAPPPSVRVTGKRQSVVLAMREEQYCFVLSTHMARRGYHQQLIRQVLAGFIPRLSAYILV